MIFKKEQIDYYKNKAFILSQAFEQQYQQLYMLDDYITDDLSNDWILADVPLLEEMSKNGIIDHMAVDLYNEIQENFLNVSLGERFYDSRIWTIEGLKNHGFWNHQRLLATKLLAELEKCIW